MPTPPKSVAEIRQSFLEFFHAKGHTIVPSSSLVPANDPTLMFTNSGMVQFKDVFLGIDKRPYVRATSVQACLRAGGKHNDLENVGYTARHHTFFEMLGNWSFGDYFKRESLKWGWELLTSVYQLPAEKLWATVYIEDDEAYDIWINDIGLPPERVVRIGDNKGKKYASDNFWMMADTGPCGPCSEIFYDHGPEVAGGPPGSPDADGDRFIEIWNHVFMQFDMQTDGSLIKLPSPCVDTGMGLERLAAVLQHVHSNYDIDLFQRLIQAASRETDCKDLHNKSLYVIADHIRACVFLISDGVIPSNEGRGYVLRRIIRRAIRHGYKLGKKTPFFHKLVSNVVREMGGAYPSIDKQQMRITEALRTEEIRFFETLAIGMEILEASLADSKNGVLHGEVAFKLHDTFGFPLDLSADVCREANKTIDIDGFNACMEQQKEKARASGKFKMDRALDYQGDQNEFVGYECLQADSKILALYRNGENVSSLKAGEHGIVVLSITPFYAESGGQVGDIGKIQSSDACFDVQDTQKIKAHVFGHHGILQSGCLSVGDIVHAQVDKKNRKAVMRNHSATHLLHLALQEVLGEHVQQKGSLVSADRTRFDFAHGQPVNDQQITTIEWLVNGAILRNTNTHANLMSLEDAKNSGAMMLFDEKYGESVRVLEIDQSKELCGGTHVKRCGDIGLFKIIAESGVAAGVRRIEAVTGENTLNLIQSQSHALDALAYTLRTSKDEVGKRVQEALNQIKTLEKELTQMKNSMAVSQAGNLADKAVYVGEIHVLAEEIQGADSKMLRESVDALRTKLKPCAIVLASVNEGKVQLVSGVSDELTTKIKAGNLANHVAQQVGGKGGGRADMAMAGGTNINQLASALKSVADWVKSQLL